MKTFHHLSPVMEYSGIFVQSVLFAKHNIHIILSGLLVIFFSRMIYLIFLHPLRRVPGPFLAKFSGFWRDLRYFRSTWHDDVLEVHRKFGPVVRIAPNEVSFVDANALLALYGHGTTARKTPWYKTWFIPNMQQSFFASQDITLHRALRSRVSAVYSMSSILAMEPFIQEVADKLWKKLTEFATIGATMDLGDWVPYFAFDVVAQLSLGGEIGFVEKGIDVDKIISSIHMGFYIMANMGALPLQMWWFNNSVSKYLVKKLGGAKLNAFDNFLQWLEKRVKARFENGLGDRHHDMLQHFVDMKGVQGTTNSTVGDVMIEGVNILGAGADTTSVAILAVLGDIVKRPEIVPRLQAELDGAYRDLGRDENNTEITYKEAITLPFLVAVIKESMRLHPSIQYQLPRYPPEGGITIREHHIPQSVAVGISPRSMNRCTEIFGLDADRFNPSRWEFSDEKEEECIKEMSRMLTTFGMGSRVCVGQNIALVEVHKFIAQFMHKFNIRLADPEKWWITRSQWFSMQSNFNVKLELRQPGPTSAICDHSS